MPRRSQSEPSIVVALEPELCAASPHGFEHVAGRDSVGAIARLAISTRHGAQMVEPLARLLLERARGSYLGAHRRAPSEAAVLGRRSPSAGLLKLVLRRPELSVGEPRATVAGVDG